MVENVGVGGACLISRDAELAAIEDFLSSSAVPLVLLFTGGPGIGKTSLWKAGLHHAEERGLRVLAARPNEAEAQHPFAGLFDLMDGVGADVLGDLPVPQRQALEAAVLRSEPAAAAQPFAISAGFLGALRSLAAAGPVLLAVDDMQWLDAASAEVLAFAARRMQDPRCRFLFARRSGDQAAVERVLSPAAVRLVDIPPLSFEGTHRLLSQRLGLTLPRRTLSQFFDATQGNPLLVLELGRMLAARGAVELGSDMPLIDLASNPFGPLVAGLARPARRALLASAMNGHVSLRTLEAVADPTAVEDLLAAGLLVADGGRVRPSHPLLAVAVRRKATTAEKRAVHLDLAGLGGDETVRARHLALAATGADAGLADVTAAAAAVALRRGAAHDAADLAEHALRLTPAAAPEVPDRLLALAECLVRVGEMERARDLFTPRIGGLPTGAARARAHLLLVDAARNLAEHEHHLERALAENTGEPALQAIALAVKSVLLGLFRVERIREAEACALHARVLARSAQAIPVIRQALVALAWARVLRGLPAGEPGEPRPAETDESGLYESSIDRPAGVRLAFRGRVGQARAAFRRLAALAEERGEYGFRSVLQIQLCEVELRAGDAREAGRLLDQWHEWTAMDYMETMRARCQALLAAIQGFPEEADRQAALALAAASAQDLVGLRWDQLEILRARGIAALLAQQPERAAETLGSVWEYTRREGVEDPGAFPVAPDLVEALVRLGRTAEAAAVTGRLRELAEGQRHPWGLATADRCAATIELASGYDDDQAARLAAAADTLGGLGLGFDRARSLLWLGQVARRARKRSAARRFLDAAAAAFSQLGCDGWAGQARADLTRLGTSSPARAGELTAAERQVAVLAADGLANKEIARRLFVTVHTVPRCCPTAPSGSGDATSTEPLANAGRASRSGRSARRARHASRSRRSRCRACPRLPRSP